MDPRPVSNFENKSIIEQKKFVFSSDPDFFLEDYFDEVKSGKFRPRTEADVEKVVALELSALPITMLNSEELAMLKSYLAERAQHSMDFFINKFFRELIEDQIYYINDVLIEKLEKEYKYKDIGSRLAKKC